MSKFALIKSNRVINIAVADTPMDASWVQIPDNSTIQAGWSYNSGVFAPPQNVYTVINDDISINAAPAAPFAGNYYCAVGDTIQLTGDIYDGSDIVSAITVPVTLKMPLVRHANGVPTTDEIYLDTTITAGALSVSGTIPWSGDWKILIGRVNESLQRIGATWTLSYPDITFLA